MPLLVLVRPRTLGRLLISLLLLTGVGALAAAPATAHVALEGSAPAAGDVVRTVPTEVTLDFNADLLEVGNAVQVTGPSGPVETEPVQVGDRRLVQPMPPDLPPGEYTVRWRAASGDGHPVEGSFAFTSTQPAPTSPTTTEGATTSDETSSTTAATSDVAVDPLDASTVPVWAGVGVALLAAVGIALAALRRGRGPGLHE